MALLIVGQWDNGTVHLFDMPVVAARNCLQANDIVKVEREYVRMYDDGKGLRSWFITDQVRAVYDKMEADYGETINGFLAGSRGM